MGGLLFLALAAVVVVAGVWSRRRIRKAVSDEQPMVTDELLRRILDEGEVDGSPDDPLDEDAIREAEDDFWEEEWDDPEPWTG